MRKFNVVVEMTKSYEVEIDDTMLSDAELAAWESAFYDLDSDGDDKIASLVRNYCELRAESGDVFIEGYGRVLKVNQEADGYFIKENEVCPYMKLTKCDDDGYPDTYLREI